MAQGVLSPPVIFLKIACSLAKKRHGASADELNAKAAKILTLLHLEWVLRMTDPMGFFING